MNATRLRELITGAIIEPAEVAELRREGCELRIERTGSRLRRAGVSLWKDYLQDRHGLAVEVYASIASTQDRVAAMPPGGVVIALQQSAGRGRLGRRWVAPGVGDCLMLSVSVKPLGALASMIASLAMAEALEAAAGLRVGIKWPNDLMVNGRKLGGVLVETRMGLMALGVGVNTGLSREKIDASPVLRDKATSLAALGLDVDPLRLLDEFLPRIYAKQADVASRWRAYDLLVGTTIQALHQGETLSGTVIDIDAQAGLILRSDDGVIHRLRAEVTTLAL